MRLLATADRTDGNGQFCSFVGYGLLVMMRS
jgi:hypothetical protein